MSRNIEQLYQEMILAHNKQPRNFKLLSPCTHQSHGVNTLCGDDYQLTLHVSDGVITDIGFSGHGCAISKSSGSLMTNSVKGKPVSEALVLKDKFLGMLIKDESPMDMGSLSVFENVKRYPVRVKCATLIWRALEDALQNNAGTVSTE